MVQKIAVDQEDLLKGASETIDRLHQEIIALRDETRGLVANILDNEGHITTLSQRLSALEPSPRLSLQPGHLRTRPHA